MTTDKQTLEKLFAGVKSDIRQEQIAKGIRASGRSAESLREEIKENADTTKGELFGADYLLDQRDGKPPGEAPDFSALYRWSIVKRIEPRFGQRHHMVKAIQNKIERDGTDIFLGKRPALDLNGIVRRRTKEALNQIGRNRAVEVASDMVKILKEE